MENREDSPEKAISLGSCDGLREHAASESMDFKERYAAVLTAVQKCEELHIISKCARLEAKRLRMKL